MNELSGASDEQQVRDLFKRWSQLLENRDLEGMFAHYHTDAVMYDVKPPYKTEGAARIKAEWQQCLPYFPEKFGSEHRDLKFFVSESIAFVHGLHHFVIADQQHPAGQSWFRVTVGFQKVDGNWRIVHEHVSLPYNPITGEVWTIADPDQLSSPDDCASSC